MISTLIRLFAHYTVFRKDRTNRGGGVAMFVRNYIHAEQVLINCVNTNLEVICVDLTLNSHEFISLHDINHLITLLMMMCNILRV